MRYGIKSLSKTLFIMLSSLLSLTAHGADAVEWKAEVVADSDSTGNIVVTAKVAEGYHFYSFAPEGGINALELKAEGSEAVTSIGEPTASIAPVSHYEEVLDTELSSWDKDVAFTIPFRFTADNGYKVALKIRYQACKDKACVAPKKVELTVTGNGYVEDENVQESAVAEGEDGTVDTWAAVDSNEPTTTQSPWEILILGFLGGLAALLTPCVWPLIPMTLSFFLKQKKGSRFNSGALTYGIAIVVIYLVLGIGITLIFGAGKLNELSTNAIFNIIFFLLLVVFAISFFGAFDIKLPQKWSNAMDSKAESTSGIISIFFMAFTLVLVSFSCTGPIIGTLLVEVASQGNILGPALGMGGFALGLAIPFTIFAFFPGMLKEMPKSGGWLNSVKVVLGFCELILSLKFLSVADLAYGWHILDRETFIAIWIVLFVLLGMYLLGKIRFSHDEKKEHVGVGRFMLAIFPLAFAVYLLPGLWGAPLKACSAFVPPLETQDFNLYSVSGGESKSVESNIVFDDYDEGMAYAKEQKLPVLIDFTGFGCVNCRNMEAEVFDTDQVRNALTGKFVMIKLVVDDRKKLDKPMVIKNGDKTITLETVGEKWTYLQSNKFKANSQPYYVILDNDGHQLGAPVTYDNNVERFVNWLEDGRKAYMVNN